MNIHRLNVENFRNYNHAQADFQPGINVISGENAQGKTNLLEAVYLLAVGKSFRTRFDREMINQSQLFSTVIGEINSSGRDQKIEIALKRGAKKSILLNGVKKTRAELSGTLTAVLFCPDDLQIISLGASVRRRLMDSCISQLRPGYCRILTDFNRNYENKSRILRDYREKPSLLNMLDEFSHGLMVNTAQLIRYRAAFVRRLQEFAAPIHLDFSGGREELCLCYKTVSGVTDPLAPAGDILKELLEHEKLRRQAEISSGLCLTGAHKDDIEIEINGSSARTFASQGQRRTAALSIKLAEREIFLNDTGEYPILLLDDVLSELDAGRQEFVLNRIGGGQTLITCCEGKEIVTRTGGKVLFVENGALIK